MARLMSFAGYSRNQRRPDFNQSAAVTPPPDAQGRWLSGWLFSYSDPPDHLTRGRKPKSTRDEDGCAKPSCAI
jgi:hypothetical protein